MLYTNNYRSDCMKQNEADSVIIYCRQDVELPTRFPFVSNSTQRLKPIPIRYKTITECTTCCFDSLQTSEDRRDIP